MKLFIYLFSLLDNVEIRDNVITVAGIIQKCKQITQKFNQSSMFAAAIRKELKKQKLGFNSLVTDVATRWNSSYNMLDRLYKARDAV